MRPAEESRESQKNHPRKGGIRGFPERLRRVIGNSSLRGFSRDCRLSEATLRSYLLGDTYPTLDRLEQIAGHAGMPPGRLAFGEEAAGEARDSTELLGWACLFLMAGNADGASSAAEVGERCRRIVRGLAEHGEEHELARAVLDIGRAQLARLRPPGGH